MEPPDFFLRNKLESYLAWWRETKIPTRSGFESVAREIINWREKNKTPGLWRHPPLFITATLDDGWGHGLFLINLWAKAGGLQIKHLGLLQPYDKVISECTRHTPDLLGLTVLQFDTEDDLIRISRNLPAKTKIVAGGPVFSADPELARRSGIHYVARDAADFVELMLEFKPQGRYS